jgi:cytochrome P450
VRTVGQIPAALMTELIGVPHDMRERFIDMSSAQMLAITINPDMDPEEAAADQRQVGEFHDYCEELLTDRQASGAEGDDLVSCIARSTHDGGPVPHGMAISFIHTFVNAGETTRSLVSFIMLPWRSIPTSGACWSRSPSSSRTRSRRRCASTSSTGRVAARPPRTSSWAGS